MGLEKNMSVANVDNSGRSSILFICFLFVVPEKTYLGAKHANVLEDATNTGVAIDR